MSARKPRFAAAERATLEPLAVRCILAAVEASRAEAMWQKDSPKGQCGDLAKRRVATRGEVLMAGKALDRAMRKIRGGQ